MDIATALGLPTGLRYGVPMRSVRPRVPVEERARIADPVRETERGLDASIVDRDGRALFPGGSSRPTERTRHLCRRN